MQRSRFNLASLYLTGNGVAQSFQKAVLWYTQALDRGHTPAASAAGGSPHMRAFYWARTHPRTLQRAAHRFFLLFSSDFSLSSSDLRAPLLAVPSPATQFTEGFCLTFEAQVW